MCIFACRMLGRNECAEPSSSAPVRRPQVLYCWCVAVQLHNVLCPTALRCIHNVLLGLFACSTMLFPSKMNRKMRGTRIFSHCKMGGREKKVGEKIENVNLLRIFTTEKSLKSQTACSVVYIPGTGRFYRDCGKKGRFQKRKP